MPVWAGGVKSASSSSPEISSPSSKISSSCSAFASAPVCQHDNVTAFLMRHVPGLCCAVSVRLQLEAAVSGEAGLVVVELCTAATCLCFTNKGSSTASALTSSRKGHCVCCLVR